MKQFAKIIPVAVCASVVMWSCGKDDEKNPTPVDPDAEYVLPSGEAITSVLFEEKNHVKLSSGNTYTLKGGVQLKEGQKITIEAGVTVKSDPVEPTTAYLLIGPGAQINAVGTADKPIVFTSGKSTPKFQDWGGIILCGRAPVNTPGGTAPSEMGVNVTYGGTNAADNSGTLKYVRVEYTGAKQSDTKEHNGFTFEGVGNGTILEYLSSYEGGDDGFEWFGGTVNAKYLVCVGAKDDLYDWTFGWTGKAQFVVGIQGDDVGDRGIEADDNEDNHGATPYSNPTIVNLVLVGSTVAKTGDDPTNPGTNATRMIEFRRGTKANIVNFVGYGFTNGVRVSDDSTIVNLLDGSLSVKDAYISAPDGKVFQYNPTAGGKFVDDAGKYNGGKPWETEASIQATTTNTAPDAISDKYKGKVDEANAVDPKTLDSWFSDGKFKGAVDPAADWTSGGWARF